MKTNNKKSVPQANKIFTDREDPRKLFWNTYSEFKNNLNEPNDIKVITYYGVGGIGKTSLLIQLRKELKEKIIDPQFVYFDFNTATDARTVLKKIRNMLQNDYNFEFPMFDLALYFYLVKLGEHIEKDEIQSLTVTRHSILQQARQEKLQQIIEIFATDVLNFIKISVA